MGMGMTAGFAWFPCTWMDGSGMSTRALEGALDNHACTEIGIKEHSTSL